VKVINLNTTLDFTNFVDLKDDNKDNYLNLLLVYKGLVNKRAFIIIK
jgi:hypothetical protein